MLMLKVPCTSHCPDVSCRGRSRGTSLFARYYPARRVIIRCHPQAAVPQFAEVWDPNCGLCGTTVACLRRRSKTGVSEAVSSYWTVGTLQRGQSLLQVSLQILKILDPG